MFKVTQIFFNGARKGVFSINGKLLRTPSPFAISNIGGGAGSIDRFVSYTDMIWSQGIPLLYNFYYLTRGGMLKIDWVKSISDNEAILDFILRQREIFRNKARIAGLYKEFRLEDNKPVVMLDTGSGNLVRDLAIKGLSVNQLISQFDELNEEYYNFGESHRFDILISLDYAGKQTFRNKEKENKRYVDMIEYLSNNSYNKDLLEKSLLKFKDGKYSFMLFAPVHGTSPEDISRNCKEILQMEKRHGIKFDGFAVALPYGGKKDVSSDEFYYNLGRSIRKVLEQYGDNRPIHGLGAGAANNVISLITGGVDTYDSNTPWRRAMDGSNPQSPDFSGAYSKFLIPLVNNEGIVYKNQQNALEYIKLSEIDNKVECDCPLCSRYSINKIKNLYKSEDKEEFYLAKMVMFMHAILQAKNVGTALIKYSNSRENLKEFASLLPPSYHHFLKKFLENQPT